jgi:hypothetical protein
LAISRNLFKFWFLLTVFTGVSAQAGIFFQRPIGGRLVDVTLGGRSGDEPAGVACVIWFESFDGTCAYGVVDPECTEAPLLADNLGMLVEFASGKVARIWAGKLPDSLERYRVLYTHAAHPEKAKYFQLR